MLMGSKRRQPGLPTTTRWSIPAVGVGEGFTTTEVEVEMGGRAWGVDRDL